MEKREIGYIRRCKPDLIKLIRCSKPLLAQFGKHGLLTEDDEQTILSKTTEIQRAALLLDILQTRKQSYQILIDVLEAEAQTGASQKLRKLYNVNLQPVFRSLPHQALRFCEGSLRSNMLLLSRDLKHSVGRFQDASDKHYIKLICSQNLRKEHPALLDLFNEVVEGYYCIHFEFVLAICLHHNDCKVVEDKHWHVEYESIKWEDLNLEYQNKLLKKPVYLQENKMPLESVCNIIEDLSGYSNSFVLSHLETEVIVSLLNNRCPCIFDGNIPKRTLNFIPRMVRRRQHISRKVLNATKKSDNRDIFVFHNANLRLYDLSPLAEKYGDGNCDYSVNQVNRKTLSASCILLGEKSDFAKICEKVAGTDFAVHLFDCVLDSGDNKGAVTEIHWSRSVGSISTLQQYCHKVQASVSEKIFYDQNADQTIPSPVCISDSPGTGKSWLLANCANQLKKSSDDSLSFVQYLRIGTLLKTLKESTIQSVWFRFVNPVDVIKSLAATFSESLFGQLFFESLFCDSQNASLCKRIRLEIMLDGIDELTSEEYEFAMHVIQTLLKIRSAVAIRVWVTARPHYLAQTERALEVLGFTILPLDNNQQVELLAKHWINQKYSSYEKMQSIAKSCLLKLTEKLPLKEEKDHIAGTPLLCILMANILKDDAHIIYEHIDQEDRVASRVSNLTITKIYEEYIDNQFDLQSPGAPAYEKHILYRYHIIKAVQFFFPEIKPSSNWFNRNIPNERLLSFGILELSNSADVTQQYRFIHITFAEFFVAQAALQAIKFLNNPETGEPLDFNIQDYLRIISSVFSVEECAITISKLKFAPYTVQGWNFVNKNVCYFLNYSINEAMLCKNTQGTALAYYKGDLFELAESLWRRLVAATYANFCYIVIPIVHAIKQLFPDPEFLGLPARVLDLLYISAKYAGKELMQKICEFVKEWSKIPLEWYFLKFNGDKFHTTHTYTLTILHVAGEAGNNMVFEYLLSKEKFSQSLKLKRYTHLIHSCVLNSVHDSPFKIKRKKNIISLIGEKFDHLIVNNPAEFYLCLERIHLDLLLKYLKVKRQAQANHEIIVDRLRTDHHGENIFHLLASGHYDDDMTPEKYHTALVCLIELFSSNLVKKYITERSCYDWRAVDVAAGCIDLLDETLELLKELGVRFDTSDFRLSTPLYIAVAGQRNAKSLQKLEAYGALRQPKMFNVSILHLAASYLNYSAVEYFVNVHKMNVDAQDEDGNTALHKCLQNKRRDLDPMFGESLQGHGVDDVVFSPQPAIPIARRAGRRCSMIDGIGTPLYSINMVSTSPNYPITVEISNQHRIIKLLIENGAKISIKNRKGQTPLHIGIDLCLKGLNQEECTKLECVGSKLFEDPHCMSLALKGLLMNDKLGHTWHPSLIFSFADEIKKFVREDVTWLFPMTARAHSFFGIKYLIKTAQIKLDDVKKYGRSVSDFMHCQENCQIIYCARMKEILKKFLNSQDIEW